MYESTETLESHVKQLVGLRPIAPLWYRCAVIIALNDLQVEKYGETLPPTLLYILSDWLLHEDLTARNKRDQAHRVHSKHQARVVKSREYACGDNIDYHYSKHHLDMDSLKRKRSKLCE